MQCEHIFSLALTIPFFNKFSTKRLKVKSKRRCHGCDHCSTFMEVPASISTERPNVSWEEYAGLETIKGLIKEAASEPGKHCKGILLFGPPGTGKSLLVNAAVTGSTESAYFSVSAYDLRRSNKLVTSLFNLAREHKPSIIYIDDVDALSNSEQAPDLEEPNKAKTEFIAQLAGMDSANGVLVIAASNKPWRLDSDLGLAFEKRVYVQLPDQQARINIYKSQIGKDSSFHTLTEEDFRTLSEKSDGYTGADIVIVVRDALMEPVRKIQNATHFKWVQGISRKNPNVVDDLLTPCSPKDLDAIEMTWMEVPEDKLREPLAEITDLENALKKSKPSVTPGDIQKFDEFAHRVLAHR